MSPMDKGSCSISENFIRTRVKCFQKLARWLEEFSTDWGCVKVFGTENSVTNYLDTHPEGWAKDYCIYEIVCKCENGCPTN